MIATAAFLANTEPRLLLWRTGTWDDYTQLRDSLDVPHLKLFFYNGSLLVDDMGWEGIDHSIFRELFSFIFAFWFNAHPDQHAASLGGCLLEREKTEAGSPDLVLYLGDDYPRWQPGDPRRISLNQWRAPDLVGEVADTSLASDLDEKKRLYAALGIAEYWVIDVRGQRVFLFHLSDGGHYQEVTESRLLSGLSRKLLEATIARLDQETNISAAQWFNQQIVGAQS
jgi:Uma2 family endonuclease